MGKMTRRKLLAGCSALATTAVAPESLWAAAASAALTDTLRAIEGQSGGRLGVTALDTATGARIGARADERFPLCSTVKALTCGAVLAQIDAGHDSLDRRIVVAASDLLDYAPVTKTRVGGPGMTLRELCDAALTWSDNTAANLLVASLGGPSAVTAFARALGDGVTRLDRTEPTLNEATPGDPRDTTSPDAMASILRRLVLEDTLAPRSRDQLATWMMGCRTGLAKLRAGVPPDWRVGDKTGNGDHGSTNDIAILWPPGGRAPLILCVYMTETTITAEAAAPLFAAVARAVMTATG